MTIDKQTFESNRSRAAWVRRHREEIRRITNLDIPRSLPAVQAWLERKQSAMTTKMRDHYGEYSTEDDEGGED